MTGKNYITTTYSSEIEVEKSPHEVFTSLVDLTKWWPEEFIGEELKLNSEFVLKTGEGHYSNNRVIEYLPDKKVAWLVTASRRKEDDFDWTGTKMIFELKQKDGKTEIKFTYDGIILENESKRLAQICDFVMKDRLYNLLTN